MPIPLLAAWELAPPLSVRPADAGTNNLTSIVATSRGDYLLRRYQNTADAARVRYEHALLGKLAVAGLSFAVPAPIPSRGGATLVVAPGGDLAALFARIPGVRPGRGNLHHLRAVGAALADLQRAMATVKLPLSSPYPTYGDLARVHSLTPDPLAAPDALPLAEDERERLRRILADLLESIPALYAALPRQCIHADYGPGNTLIVGDRISGVLDFEFAGPDLRAIDVATGFYWTAGEAWDGGDPWPLLTAFLDGYLAAATFTPAEAAALPALSRLQRATALVHWLGRWRAGQADEARVVEQARRLLRLDAWLGNHGAALVAYAEARRQGG